MPSSNCCCVIGCSNSYNNTVGKGVIFYRFPGRDHNIDRKKEWISNIRRINADGTPWQPSKHARVCSDHFITKRKNDSYLHPDYVPTVFPKCYNKNKNDGMKKAERFERLQERNLKKVCLKRFHPDEVKRMVSIVARESGDLLTVPLMTPRLKPGSVPSIFPALPTTSTTASTSASEKVADDSQDLEISLIDDALENSRDSLCLEDALLDKSLCRICGQMESDLTSLYGSSAIEMGLLRKIEDCLRIKIDNSGYLPTEICKTCISNLDLCDRFITLARNANIRLHEMYSDQMDKLLQNEPPMTCQYCDKEFRTPTLLNLHLSTHSTAAVFLCEICGGTFKNAEGLICHKRIHFDVVKKKKHACCSCDKTFRSRFDLLEHANCHSGVKPHSCSTCGKAFHRRAQLRQHSLVHRAANTLTNRCVKCGKVFSRYSDLRMHMRRHEVGRTFKCAVCALSLPSISALLSHRKQHQSATKNDSELKLSKKTSPTPGSEEKFRCKDCGKQLSGRSALSYHQKAFHGGSKPYSCQQCDKTFMSEGLKRIHEHRHSDAEPYLCTICNKSFKNPNVLNQHLKDHSSASTYECPHCEKQFKRKGHLSVHVRTHTGEKPFTCGVCAHTFAQKSDMLKHITRQHCQRSKPLELSCELCNLKFSDSNELNDHKEKIHVITMKHD